MKRNKTSGRQNRPLVLFSGQSSQIDVKDNSIQKVFFSIDDVCNRFEIGAFFRRFLLYGDVKKVHKKT